MCFSTSPIDLNSGLPSSESEKVKPEVHQLPSELIQKVLSYLNEEDLQSTVQVSHRWRVETIEWVIQDKFSQIKKTLRFFSENLNPELYQDQIKGLGKIVEGMNLFTSKHFDFEEVNSEVQIKSLLEVKQHTLRLREEILKILQDIKDEGLSLLENASLN